MPKKKILKITFPEKCIGCELCVMEVQRQLDKVGLNGALMRVHKSRSPDNLELKYSITMDPQINSLDASKLLDICPTGVFTLEEEEDNELFG